MIYKDQAPRVYAINYVALPDISQASQNLINRHEQVYLTKERPLIQQQTVINLKFILKFKLKKKSN